MPTRAWTREYVGGTFVSPNFNGVSQRSTLGAMLAPHINSTLVRTILDLRCTIVIDDTAGGGPSLDWWGQVHPECAVGRTDLSIQDPLYPVTIPDERVMGTGQLGLVSFEPTLKVAGRHVAVFELKQTLDSHGMRKPIQGGTGPLSNVTVQVYPTKGVLNPALTWEVWWWGYHRALWETP